MSNYKRITIDINGLKIEFESVLEAAKFLGLAAPNVSVFTDDGKKHKTTITYSIYSTPDYTTLDDPECY